MEFLHLILTPLASTYPKDLLEWNPYTTYMKLIEVVQAELLALTEEERLENLKAISYFLSCAAQVIKAEGTQEVNLLSGDE